MRSVTAAMKDSSGTGSCSGAWAALRSAGPRLPVYVSAMKFTSAKKTVSNRPRSQTLAMCW